MTIKIAAYANGDDALVAWQLDKKIPDCLGFALYRRRNGKEEVVENRIGWEDIAPPPKPGTHKPSTEWPIQRFLWSDYDAKAGDKLQYRIVPMVGTTDQLKEATSEASDWTPAMLVSAGNASGISAFFNRGVVMSQAVARRLKAAGGSPTASLKKAIGDPNNETRQYLTGQLGETLAAELTDFAEKGGEIHAALFELNDPQLLDLILAFGKRAHIILSNGAHQNASDDENKAARHVLTGKVDLQDVRLLGSRHLAHNKFCVFSDAQGQPQKTWTGSQNWTETGLCTQANNSLLIQDGELGQMFIDQWKNLVAAGDDFTPELLASNAKPRTFELDGGNGTLFFSPSKKVKDEEVGPDLVFARQFIEDAKSGILFLMFNPGPQFSLLNAILDRVNDEKKPPIHVVGVINQDPSSTKTKVEVFTGHEKQSKSVDQKGFQDIIQPDGLDKNVAEQWLSEITRGNFLHNVGHAMIHSKVVVVDPFGDHPVVITGSNNFGPAASLRNDENLLIIENDKTLAEAYVVNIASLHNAYRWRFARESEKGAQQYHGLHTTPEWQEPYLKYDDFKGEIAFWVGQTPKKPAAAAKRPRASGPRHPHHLTTPR
jgi:phosphatidylserine/phosphatidylglycerophosphate/cardiolipin synthase-like enzyme